MVDENKETLRNEGKIYKVQIPLWSMKTLTGYTVAALKTVFRFLYGRWKLSIFSGRWIVIVVFRFLYGRWKPST